MTVARHRIGTAAVAAVLAAGAAAGSADAASGATAVPHPPRSRFVFPPRDKAAGARLAVQARASDAIDDALHHVQAMRPSCKPSSPFAQKPTTDDVAPDPALVALIAALRRPAGPQDVAPARGGPAAFGFGTTHASSIRVLTSASGAHATISVAAQRRLGDHASASCLAAERRELARRLRSARPVVARRARREFESYARDASKPVDPTVTDGLQVFTERGGGGGADAREFAARGEFFSSGGAGQTSTLTGVVPDGVVSIELDYPRVVSHGRDFAPTVYPRAVTRTVRVLDNLVVLRAPRPADDAFPPRMVWRGADGAVVRVVTQPR